MTALRPISPPLTPLATVAAWLSSELVAWRGSSSGPVVTGICLDSRRVQPGDIYAALSGGRGHGAAFTAQARSNGAAAVLTDEEGARIVGDLLPTFVVPRPRAVLGRLSAQVYGEPAAHLRLVGVTGTQGKTTTTRLLDAALQQSGTPSAVVGTVGTRIAGEEVKTALTTPEAPDLHALFAVMGERGVRACAMEVSSHALVMGRVDGVVFDVAVFTNLGRDHLDFHADEEEYFAAKAALFTPARARLALVNADDAHGVRLASSTLLPVRTFATDPASSADWSVEDVRASPGDSTFTVRHGTRTFPAAVPLPGAFNVANALAAIAAIGEVGLDAEAAAVAMGSGPGVPGRLERVEAGQDFTAVVDYAHKPDALAAVLHALRPETKGRLILVIGAGGDRDQGKRPLMGEVAARLADVVVVTDDNPRSEDPAVIRAAILAGAGGGRADLREVGGRGEAIRSAVGLAGPGDVLVVAGKGHETGQEVAGTVHPFDDRVVLREALARAGDSTGDDG